MKFDRLKLIERIDEIEEGRKAAHGLHLKPMQEVWDAAVREWKATGSKKLAVALRDLAAKAGKGQLVTWQDIAAGVKQPTNDELYWKGAADPESNYHTISKRPEATPYKPDSNLAALRALLLASSDQQISSSGIKELGFSPAQFINAAV